LSLLAESHDDIFEPSENYCLIQGRTTNVLCNSYRTNVQLTEREMAYSGVEVRFAAMPLPHWRQRRPVIPKASGRLCRYQIQRLWGTAL